MSRRGSVRVEGGVLTGEDIDSLCLFTTGIWRRGVSYENGVLVIGVFWVKALLGVFIWDMACVAGI